MVKGLKSFHEKIFTANQTRPVLQVCLGGPSSSTIVKVRLLIHDWRRRRQETLRTQQRSGEWWLLMCHPYRTDGHESHLVDRSLLASSHQSTATSRRPASANASAAHMMHGSESVARMKAGARSSLASGASWKQIRK